MTTPRASDIGLKDKKMSRRVKRNQQQPIPVVSRVRQQRQIHKTRPFVAFFLRTSLRPT